MKIEMLSKDTSSLTFGAGLIDFGYRSNKPSSFYLFVKQYYQGMEIIEIHLTKDMDTGRIQAVLDRLESLYKIYGPLNILAFVDSSAGYDSFSTYLKSNKMRGYFYTLIRRYAIVTPNRWFIRLGNVTDVLTPEITLKFFTEEVVENAKSWLVEGEALPKKNLTLQFKANENITSFHINDQLNESDFRMMDSVIIEDYTYNMGVVHLHLDFTGMDMQVVIDVLPRVRELKHWSKVSSLRYTFEGDDFT